MLVTDVTADTVAMLARTEGSWLAAGAAIGVALLGMVAARRLRGTTLVAPALWAVAAGVGVAGVEALISLQESADPLSVSLARYAAAVGAFCPLMAVLGAKRPQDRGWQWVVLSLWIVLLVPAMQAVAARSGRQLELFVAWRLLIWMLIAMGLLNYLPTRFAWAALLIAIGQVLLLSPALFVEGTVSDWRHLGAGLIFAGSLLAALVGRSGSHTNASGVHRGAQLQNCDRRWLNFRNAWGAFWGLRILQRVNQTAELSRWPVRLDWSQGFAPSTAAGANGESSVVDDATLEHMQQTLDALLRRFERLDGDATMPPPHPARGIAN